MTLGLTTGTILTLAVLLGGDPATGAGADTARLEEDGKLVRYDLRTVLPRFDVGSSWRQSLGSDLADPNHEFPSVKLHELYEEAPAEVILDVITQVLGDELHHEGRELTLEGEHALLVLAPQAIQAQVLDVLDALESAFSSATEVSLDVFTLDSGAGDPTLTGLTGGVLTPQQADRLTDRLKGQGAQHARHRLGLSPGRTAIIDQTQRISFTGEYDVEVAQGAFSFDPVTTQLRAGMRIMARGVPTRGGTILSLIVSNHTAPDGVRERPIRLTGAVGSPTEGGMEFLSGPDTLQTVDLVTHSFACTTLLPDAGAVVMTSELNRGGRRSLQVLVLRSARSGAAALQRHAIPGTDRTLMVMNSEALHRPSISLESGTFYFDQPFLFVTLDGEPSSFLFDWLPFRFSVWRQLGPWAVIVTDPAWDDRGAAELEQLVGASTLEEKTLQVSVELTDSASGSPPLASWSVPALSGTECGLILGHGSTLVRDYDVEVAQYATVLDPVVAPTFEGLVLELALARKGSELFVSAAGTAQRATSTVATLEFKGPFAGHVDHVDEEVFDFDEHRRVQIGQSVRLGTDSGGASATPGLRLQLSFAD